MEKKFGGVAALVRKSALEWGRSQIGSENYNYRAALGKRLSCGNCQQQKYNDFSY